MRTIFLAPWLIALASVPADRLYAHDFWIEPVNFSPKVGEVVPLVLRVGQDLSGDRLPYINDWFSDYRVVSAGGARPVEGLMGDDPAGSFTALEPGIHVVGYRSTRDFVELEPEKFESYLADEGLEGVIELRAARGEENRSAREYYSRCAKSLLDVESVGSDGNDGNDGNLSDTLGYTLELIPETNPYRMTAGEEFSLRLLYLGEPIEGILVQGFSSAAADDRIAGRTDADGRVVLRLERPGLWLIKAVHMIETPDTVAAADWESFWASLTFRLQK